MKKNWLVGPFAAFIVFVTVAAYCVMKPDLGTTIAAMGSAAIGVAMIGIPPLTIFLANLLRDPNIEKLKVLDRHVVRVEDGFVVERNRHGQIVGKIDPSGHYRVVPTTVKTGLGFYVITQGDQQIEISSRMPKAEYLLCEVLDVKLWPPDHFGALPF